MKTLREIPLRQVPVVEPSAALDEAIALMEADPLKTVVLVGDEQFMGVFNQEALESNLIPPGADLSLLQVGPYVHPSRVIGDFNSPVETVIAHMKRRGLDLIPVVENVTYRGMVTLADLLAT
jgi:CBS domain-containing protein